VKMKKILAMVLTIAMALSVCSVSAVAAYGDPYEYDFEYTIPYTGSAYYDQVNLWSELETELSYDLDEDIVIEDIDFWTESDYDVIMDYGSLDLSGYDKGTYEVDLTDEAYDALYEDGYLYENTIYYWATDGYWDYEGEIDITITTDDYDLEYDLEGDAEFYLGQRLANDLNHLMSDTLDYVYLEEDRDNDCGTLYVDDYAEEVFDDNQKYYYNEDDRYYYDVEDLYFVADGTEGEFILYYYAYGLNDEEIEGVITIYCDGGLLIEVDIANDGIYTFDSAVFQEAVDEWNDDYTLIYIDNVKLADSTDGTLYYDYEEGSKRNVEISNREEYYVDQNKDDVLDYISFVPAEDTTGTVNVSFDAFVEKRKGSDETLAGTLKINVTKAADITVYAAEEEEVAIDWEDFQNYLEEDIDNDDYDVAYVVISGAPRTEQTGYLICEGDDLTSRGDKTFYMDPTRTQYDLTELSYMGGTKKGTYSATFTVYYYKNSTNRVYSTHEGTINFVVGQSSNVGNSLSGIISAAETMNFAASVSAFEALGGNDNEYITFTTYPVGGKLVYGWGTANQEDVQIGAKYYLSYKAGEKLLSNITFVPSYSANKTQKTVTIGIRGYNDKDKAVLGTINIGITYAARSKQFTDVTTNTYADSVDFLLNQGITTGATTYTFNPNGNVKRAEFVTFLWRAAGKPEPSAYVTNKFTDVKNSGEYQYAYKAILWAVEKGITTGTTATTFSPAANVTHEQLIAFLYRYDVNLLGHAGTGSYTVSYAGWSSVPQYAQAPAKWAAYKGILTDSTTYPTTAGTRATVALWLHRMLTL